MAQMKRNEQNGEGRPPPQQQTQVLLVYLRMRWGQIDSTFRNDNLGVQCYPLLGLQYLSAALKGNGFSCRTWDERLESFRPADLAAAVREQGVRLVGFYTAFSLSEPTIDFIHGLRQETDVPVAVGGPGAYDFERFLNAGANAVCFSEGDATMVELARTAVNGAPVLEDIAGIAWRSNGKTVRNRARPLLGDLDALPFPDRDPARLRLYRDFCNPAMRLPFATIMASRGCPMRCSYCTAWRHWGEQVRARSPANVLAEIEDLVRRHGVRYITMLDSVFGVEWDWLEEFCSRLAERRYPLRYKVNFCPSTHASKQPRAFRLLRRSGCDTIVVGMQAADEATLARIQRQTEGRSILTSCLRHARAEDLLTIVHFMSGFPFEPENEVDRIIDLLVEARPAVIDCYPLVFLPNTELRESLRAGEIHETYPYEERLKLAGEVKKRFYGSPRNIARLLSWIARNNPGWFIRMLANIPFGLSVIGFDLFKRRPDVEIPIQ